MSKGSLGLSFIIHVEYVVDDTRCHQQSVFPLKKEYKLLKSKDDRCFAKSQYLNSAITPNCVKIKILIFVRLHNYVKGANWPCKQPELL